MMRRSTANILGFLLGITLSIAVFAESPPTAAQNAAEQYFQALKTGNVATLHALASGRMKARIGALVANPDYAAALQNDNADRTFNILAHQSAGGGVLEIDYQMKSSGDQLRKRLYMVPGRTSSDGQPTYLIIEDQILP